MAFFCVVCCFFFLLYLSFTFFLTACLDGGGDVFKLLRFGCKVQKVLPFFFNNISFFLSAIGPSTIGQLSTGCAQHD